MTGFEALAVEVTAATIRESEKILSAALWVEEPDGVAIIDMAGHGRLLGLCHGSGHHTASAFGRAGIGVFCAVREIVTEVLGRLPHVGMIRTIDSAADVLLSAVAPIAAHEAAHALVAQRDFSNVIDVAEIRRLATDCRPEDVRPREVSHHPAWLAACHVVFSRCASIAPGEFWHARLTLEHELYGLPFDPVAEIVAGIDLNANIRETLADPEIGARLAEITNTNAAVTLAAA